MKNPIEIGELPAKTQLSRREVAQILGISETTSRTQYSRARALLQEKIKKIEK